MTQPTTEQRELLELAAKAANVAGEYRRVHQAYGDQWVDGIALADHPYFWNPLTDDGDALRLAVKLNLSVLLYPGSHVDVVAENITEDAYRFAAEGLGSDPYAATRRAIVRAAAAIAKGEK